jgi:hypothetical protein
VHLIKAPMYLAQHVTKNYDICTTNRRVSKMEWGTFFLVEAGVNKLGKTCNLIVAGIFHGTTIHCLLVVVATVEVAQYFHLFLFIAMLNADGSMHQSKRMKFPNL